MNIHNKHFLLFVFIILFLVACQSPWKQPIPNGEIVYQLNHYHPFKLSFIQATGKNNIILDVDPAFEKPVWSTSDNFLYGLSGGVGSYIGYPAYWDIDDGHFDICDQNIPFFSLIQGYGNIDNPYEVIVQDIWEIALIDLNTCKPRQTFIDYSDRPGEYSIVGFSYNQVTNELVYGLVVNPYNDRKYKLMKLDISTGAQLKIGEGINPSWSPDGSKIAYLGLEGLEVISLVDLKVKTLVKKKFFDTLGSGSGWETTPIPRWSPDGSWLIFHRCDTDTTIPYGCGIYKVNLNTHKEILVVLGGIFPSWRTK